EGGGGGVGEAGRRGGPEAVRGVVRGGRPEPAGRAHDRPPGRAARGQGRRRGTAAHPPGAVERPGAGAGRGRPGLPRAGVAGPGRAHGGRLTRWPVRYPQQRLVYDKRPPPSREAVMRVLVTGGAGFIGSHLTDALVTRGDEVSVADDLSSGVAARVPAGAVLHKLSVTEAGPLGDLVAQEQPDLICHLAAQISVTASLANPAGHARAHAVGT